MNHTKDPHDVVLDATFVGDNENDTNHTQDLLDVGLDAHYAGNYKKALVNYENFFDHALEIDEGYYGVRLSFNLGYWSDLADAYPPARDSLENKKKESFELAKSEMEPERFHDFVSICEHQGSSNEVVDNFRVIDNNFHGLAKQCFEHAFPHLVDEGAWDLCDNYLGDTQDLKITVEERLDKHKSIIETENDLYSEASTKSWSHKDILDFIPSLDDSNSNTRVNTISTELYDAGISSFQITLRDSATLKTKTIQKDLAEPIEAHDKAYDDVAMEAFLLNLDIHRILLALKEHGNREEQVNIQVEPNELEDSDEYKDSSTEERFNNVISTLKSINDGENSRIDKVISILEFEFIDKQRDSEAFFEEVEFFLTSRYPYESINKLISHVESLTIDKSLAEVTSDLKHSGRDEDRYYDDMTSHLNMLSALGINDIQITLNNGRNRERATTVQVSLEVFDFAQYRERNILNLETLFKDSLALDISHILLALKNCGKPDRYEAVRTHVFKLLKSEDLNDVIDMIAIKIAAH
ncbi:hypothetical protein BOW53_15365 [Solemya pervernicosa gill symbiont]|uniref:Uncharacterized protein n=1 Tax=Solemya pervernicosa gill symbiont TaxID=642797 RepID=A0A1T2L0A4_9GAMM|nr:hypothetical protein [Solemya pervernicosa gill symbiont]OOZ38494.1 hypothetical protein BOW53_15365 [Solemya pervernicosa gill symbiont]